MDSYIVIGGNRLCGEIAVQASKNAVLPMLAASLLTEEEITLSDCPFISDVSCMMELLESFSLTVHRGREITVSGRNAAYADPPAALCSAMRSSAFLLGACLARFGEVFLPKVGGCAIGERPIDLHLSALQSLGVAVKEGDRGVLCRIARPSGGRVCLPYPSVGATENLMLYGALADGETVIRGAAAEPEIVDLQNFLNRMGARIRGAGTREIAIAGKKRLHGAEYRPMSDRIECGTYLIACACCGGEIALSGAADENFGALADKLLQNGCQIGRKGGKIVLKSASVRRAIAAKTGPYPAFATDLQPPLCVLAAVSNGESRIVETVFERRFSHLSELGKMGLAYTVSGNVARIRGGKLRGTKVSAADLRGGAALVLAGLSAEGESEIANIGYIDRGYADFERKLSSLGAKIERVPYG